MDDNLKISVIIIGYNTSYELEKLFISINKLKSQKDILEVIYIDDCSSDSSFSLFEKFPLNIKKRGKILEKNCGRTFATQEGINYANGNWYLFVRSNETVHPDLILKYKDVIKHTFGFAYMGCVKYKSTDKKFEKYLNHNNRGINKKQIGQSIHYKFLLFNNALIKKEVFKHIKLNQDLTHYGGEELDFSFKLNDLFPNMIFACPQAVVYRNNYPSFLTHCKRLEEFGFINFKMLSKKLKLDVVNYKILLNKSYLLQKTICIADFFISYLNIYILQKSSYILVRVQFLTSILKGYYKKQE